MLDVEKLTKDIKSIFDKYPYKKRALNIKALDKDIGNYIRMVHDEVKDLEFPVRCLEMNKVYKIINDLKGHNEK